MTTQNIDDNQVVRFLRKYWILLTAISVLVGGAFSLGLYFGGAKFEKEKEEYYRANQNLQADTTNKGKLIVELQDDLAACLKTYKNIKEEDNHTEFPEEKNENKPIKKEQNPTVTKKKETLRQTTKVNKEFDEKTAELQIKLDFFIEQNRNLLDENDKLKGDVSLMQQQLNRARDFEQKIKLERDNLKKDILSKQRDELLSKVENKMKELVPDNNPITPIKTNTITITQTVTDYEKLGDDNLKKAMELDEKLRTHPDSYFLGLKKNKTKTDFISSALSSYNSALENYKLGGNNEKIQMTESKIKEFKKTFNL